MPFQEKSAWIMSLALLIRGAFYFGIVASMSFEIGQLAPPILPLVAIYTAILIVIAIAGHVVVAAFAPKDANAKLDERERKVIVRAGNRSGNVFGIAVVLSLGLYLVTY